MYMSYITYVFCTVRKNGLKRYGPPGSAGKLARCRVEVYLWIECSRLDPTPGLSIQRYSAGYARLLALEMLC
jgi:hypothetical protein